MKLTNEALNLMPDEYSDRLVNLFQSLEKADKLYYFPSRAMKIAKEVKEEIAFIEEMGYCTSGEATKLYEEFEYYLKSLLGHWQEWVEEDE